MDLQPLGRVLILLAVVLGVVGALLLVGGRLGLGRLPGDFSWGSGNVRVYAPIATSIVLSLVLTIVLNLVMRR